MVIGPGGYRCGDDWKYGLALLVLSGLAVVVYIPLACGV
jgi:di/tricarboxylate transporter